VLNKKDINTVKKAESQQQWKKLQRNTRDNKGKLRTRQQLPHHSNIHTAPQQADIYTVYIKRNGAIYIHL
jgi:hypothetical protein